MRESDFQFSNPIIEKMDYEINEQFNPKESPFLNQHFHIDIARAENATEAIVRLNIKIGIDENKPNAPFLINFTIGAKFLWRDVFDEPTINGLLSVNAPSLLLSYARPIISTITSTSPTSSYNIPFINFLDNKKDN